MRYGAKVAAGSHRRCIVQLPIAHRNQTIARGAWNAQRTAQAVKDVTSA